MPNAGDGLKESCCAKSRMRPKEDEEPQGARTVTKPVPTESEKPTGPVVQYKSSSGSEAQKDAVPSSVATPITVEAPPESRDVEMVTKELDATPRKPAKTIMGLEICVLEASDDVLRPILTLEAARRQCTTSSDTRAEPTEGAGETLLSPKRS